MDSLSSVHPYYQFSLQWYIGVFLDSLVLADPLIDGVCSSVLVTHLACLLSARPLCLPHRSGAIVSEDYVPFPNRVARQSGPVVVSAAQNGILVHAGCANGLPAGIAVFCIRKQVQ